MPTFELWINTVHRPLDAETAAQAVRRGTDFARRYRTPNVRQVRVMQIDPGQEPQELAVVDPWQEG